jgi:NADPH-dependent glutamate synthase beta subunit-like oxidoreductase
MTQREMLQKDLNPAEEIETSTQHWKWRWWRLAVQIAAMLLFIHFVVWPRAIGSGTVNNLFFRLDPLAGIMSMLATRTWISNMALGIATLLLTIVVGRIWCSWICPLGAVFDWVPSLRLDRTKLYIHTRWRYVKYFILFTILVAAAAGTLAFMWLDPITLITRTASMVSQRFLDVPFLTMFAAVLALNFAVSRFWCRYLCPLGGLLALFSKIPLVRHKVDTDKCTACSSIPLKSGRARQDASPCKVECPAHNDIQGYVSLAARGRFREALELIKETSPLPSVCGRVCHHPCELECNRRDIDAAVSIRSIERFLADHDRTNGGAYVPKLGREREEKVAVIGSGPTGLAAAYFLAKDGYKVRVFEKLPVAGGMMAVGIPVYRLPRKALSDDIGVIQKMGVEIRTGVTFGEDVTFDSLRKEGCKAFFLATGLHKGIRLNLPNEDLKGVLNGIQFLRDVALGNPVQLGRKVIVVGGGNVAVDVGMSAIRQGAAEVSLVCLEERHQMPAWEHEINEAVEEGIKIVNGLGPNRFLEEDGRLSGIEFKRCTSVFDEKGDFNPKYNNADLTRFEADTVILAIGQSADLSFAKGQGIPTNAGGRLETDPITLETPIKGVFAGGDAVRGPKTVIESIADGKKAAISIDRFLNGLDLRVGRNGKLRALTKSQKVVCYKNDRVQMPCLDPQERVKNFEEVQIGLTEDMVFRESKRCNACASCCVQSCPMGAIHPWQRFAANPEECTSCFACIDVCPNHAVSFGRRIWN